MKNCNVDLNALRQEIANNMAPGLACENLGKIIVITKDGTILRWWGFGA